MAEGRRLLGRVALLQIQRERVKQQEVYDPAPLLQLDRLLLTADGVLAPQDAGWMVDVHHRSHPSSRRWSPHRSLSMGFTSHYRKMEHRFGSLPLGVAAENLVVAAEPVFSVRDLAPGLLIRGDHAEVALEGMQVAEPCVPFTRYLLGTPAASAYDVEEDLAFLQGGTRGFVVGLTDLEEPVEIRVGDEVWLRA